jgi:PKD repeat protein
MNRNYPDPHSGPHPDNEEYQLETQWFMQFAQDVPFVMAANYHGGSEVMNYPWDNSYTLHADDAWWKMVCHEYADLCHTHSTDYMVLYDPDSEDGIINGALWYMIGGGRQDYMNGFAQCREVTIECSNSKLPNANQLPTYWTYNKEGIFAYMTQCLYGIHGTVTDRATGQPLDATITIEGHDDEYSFVKSHLPAGDYHRPIKGGTYQVTYAKNGYYPQTHTITVADGETVIFDVQLDAGQGLIPDFNASATVIAPNTSVNFTDNTWGPYLASWEWTFEGGEPATSSLQNPTVTYNQTGTFDVTLTVTNEDGQVETITKPDYIIVRESYNMHNGSETTCDAMFYDNGGPDGNYSNRKNYTMTFFPGADNHMIKVSFSEFALEADYDFLYIYDGTSTNATLIGSYTGGTSPGEVTATNSQGALTFQFSSDQAVNASGWKAHVTCFDPLSIDETQSCTMVYPNPSQGSFTIKAQGETAYQLHNSLGQCVVSGHFCDETQIDARHLSQGVYLLQLVGEQGIHVEKIVIEK